MKVLLLNGSPRKGNTYAALEAVKKDLENVSDIQVKEIIASDVNVSPCIACESCGSGNGCVFDDDTNDVIEAVVEADAVVFATPVYWWGMTAQLKLIIDKMYSKADALGSSGKKVCLIITGEAEQDDPQYELIPKQFGCICDYLNWDIVCCRTFTAAKPSDLAADENAIAELKGIADALKQN